MGFPTIDNKGVRDSLTLVNDSGTALAASDIGSPVTLKGAATRMATLCSDGDRVFFMLEAVSTDAAYVTVGRNKVYTDVAYTGTAPDPTSATPWVAANGAGGVKASTDPTNAVVLAVNTTAGTCDILVQ